MREVKCDKQKGNRGHSFSTYTKFFEKLLPPDTHTYVCISEGKKCSFFEKFCVRTKWMTP